MGYRGSNLWVSCMKSKCPTHYAIASIPPGVSCLWGRPCLCAPLTREAWDSFSRILLLLGPSVSLRPEATYRHLEGEILLVALVGLSPHHVPYPL